MRRMPLLAAFRPRRVPGRAAGFRLLAAAALLVPAFGVALAGLAAWREVRQEAMARLDRTAEMLRQHALRAFGTQETILRAVSHAVAGRDPAALREDTALHALLADLSAAEAPLVRGVLVTDAASRILLASWEHPARPADLADRDYMQALRAGAPLAVGTLVESRPMGWPVFTVARPARAGGGTPLAVVSSFGPDAFAAFYASVAETRQDVLLLLRTDGAVLARYPAVGPGADDAARPALAALAAARAVPGVAPATLLSPLDGQERLFAARQVGDWPVVVAYGLSTSALHAAWWRRMEAPVVGGAVAAALLLALTALAAREARRRWEAAEQRAEAEAQLARAGRAAALGLLAGGLAHEVRNLVQAVRSGVRLIERRAAEPEAVRRTARLLDDAAVRGRDLVDRMVVFGRGAEEAAGAAPRFDPGTALPRLAELLGRTLGSGYRLRAELEPGLPEVAGDRSGFETAVVNLCANARDAMPAGGSVTLRAAPAVLEAPDEPAGLPAGRYVTVAVEDTGHGMDEATLARAGEPFFTTKRGGDGGLGLATVRGFCTRAGGALRIESAPGRGTVVAMWLPVAGPRDASAEVRPRDEVAALQDTCHHP